jgi:hypothetical protein
MPSNHAVQRTETAPLYPTSRPVGGCAVPAADGERWADDGLTARGKALKMIRLPRWLPSSPALALAAPRGSLIGPARGGGSAHRVLRKSSRPRAVGKQQPGPSSRGTVRSAGADLRLGGLQSGLLEHALGDVRGGTRGLRRHRGLQGGHGAVHRRGRIGAVSIWLPLSNHAVQRTPGARILRDTGSAAGGAPGAADGERWVDRENRKGSTLDGGDKGSWGEQRPRRTPAIGSTGSRHGCLGWRQSRKRPRGLLEQVESRGVLGAGVSGS